jgi:hypothetical protein
MNLNFADNFAQERKLASKLGEGEWQKVQT